MPEKRKKALSMRERQKSWYRNANNIPTMEEFQDLRVAIDNELQATLKALMDLQKKVDRLSAEISNLKKSKNDINKSPGKGNQG